MLFSPVLCRYSPIRWMYTVEDSSPLISYAPVGAWTDSPANDPWITVCSTIMTLLAWLVDEFSRTREILFTLPQRRTLPLPSNLMVRYPPLAVLHPLEFASYRDWHINIRGSQTNLWTLHDCCRWPNDSKRKRNLH